MVRPGRGRTFEMEAIAALASCVDGGGRAAKLTTTDSTVIESAAVGRLGDRVEAQYGSNAHSAWFAGIVMAVNADGTCDVHYDDGDKEAGKPWSRVRPLTAGKCGARKSNKSSGGGKKAARGALR